MYWQGFIRNRQFDPQEWFIPGSCADHFEETTLFPDSGCAYTSRTRIIKGKVIADTVEALIGVFLTAAGEKAALKFIEWLGIKMEFHQETAPERKDLLKYEMYINTKDLQSVLNYSFRNPALLLEALTHASYQIPDVPGCYQVCIIRIMLPDVQSSPGCSRKPCEREHFNSFLFLILAH